MFKKEQGNVSVGLYSLDGGGAVSVFYTVTFAVIIFMIEAHCFFVNIGNLIRKSY